jgi:hypothetical protein
MKRRLLILIVAMGLLTGLASCLKNAQSMKTTSNREFQVELLFVHDGVRVYRFQDNGRYIYYTDARGKTEWQVPKAPNESVETVE